jgi:hypothetical protein
VLLLGSSKICFSIRDPALRFDMLPPLDVGAYKLGGGRIVLAVEIDPLAAE